MYYNLFRCMFSGGRARRFPIFYCIFPRVKKIAWKFINYTQLFIEFGTAAVVTVLWHSYCRISISTFFFFISALFTQRRKYFHFFDLSVFVVSLCIMEN